jgi:acyl transferase domain-containing protein/thioesterase domain-containing protein
MEQSMTNGASSLDSLEGIAVVGMAGRFPAADSVDEFWRNLRDGVESITFFTDEELLAIGVSPAQFEAPAYVKAKAVLKGVEMFDAQFFGYSPREVEILDPQHRLFLECAWEALENAGYDPETYHGKIGVFAGTAVSSYLLNNLLANPEALILMGGYQASLANDKDYLATRVSYKLNLTGPSVSVQTACSTSLVAVHLACQSLLSYQSDMVLSGGVTVAVPQEGYTYREGGIGSPDGHCRPFDAEARGTVGGSGCGIVVLKRLEDALTDGDTVHAVIKGSAINNDGSGKVGYTAPSVRGQATVIAEAQSVAGVGPESIGMIEAHGTGTFIGDPIELKALTQVFRAGTQKKSFCALGSVKSNIGHLDTAAGIAGLMKTILSIKHRAIPPSLHFKEPNPQVDYDNIPFYVNTSLRPWHANGSPRRAGVSSFGIGGTNAHAIVEEAPELPESGPSLRAGQVLLISARTEAALEQATCNLAAHLRDNREAKLEDVAYTLAVGRRAFTHRRAVACRDFDEALHALTDEKILGQATGSVSDSGRSLVFMFSGQGMQRVGMGRELYATEKVFRDEFDRCASLLRQPLDLDLRELLYQREERHEEAAASLRQTWLTQPALFAFEYALARQWMAWGARPAAMIGHSIGEYVAACLAGVFTLEDALRVVAARGRLMQALPGGAMLAVMADEGHVSSLLERHDTLSLAAVNGASQCVVSGTVEAVGELERELNGSGEACKRLETSHAFHSTMMEPALEEFHQVVARAGLREPHLPWVSNVTGDWITHEEATDAGYWVRHLRHTVRFSDGLCTLLKDEARVLLEIGPGQALASLARSARAKGSAHAVVPSFGPAVGWRGDARETAQLLSAAGQLWVSGVRVDWAGFYAGERRRRVPLPTYPFERQRFWIEGRRQPGQLAADKAKLVKKPDLADWFYVPAWKQSLPPMPIEAGQLAGEEKCWLVLLDDLGFGSRLARRLEREGQYVVIVRRGESFVRKGERNYEIGPGWADGYSALLQELAGSEHLPQKVVHLWSVGPEDETRPDAERFADAQRAGYYSLVGFAQGLGAQLITSPLELILVTNNTQKVGGDETIYPERATALAPCKVIPQEYPNVKCRSIDIVLPRSPRQEEELLEQLLAELARPTTETVIALRGDERWVESFEAVRLDEKRGSRKFLRDGGVYMVTGGLGGVSLALATQLARAVRAKLALVGRTTLPDRSEWARWLKTRGEDDETSRKIRHVLELEELGAEVLILRGDVTDEREMREALALISERFGDVHGVIHAAGLSGHKWNPPIEQTGRVETERHFRPKVDGTLVIEKVFEGKSLDFCVFVSSLSCVLGGYGMVAYAAANLFMDAFARSRRKGKFTEWVSVNWDGWRTREETTEHKDVLGSGLAELEIRPQEGGEAFQRILSQTRTAQVVVSTADLPTRMRRWIALESFRDADSAQNSSATLHRRPELQSAYVAPRNEVEETIVGLWQSLLGVEHIGIDDDFFELGGHSLAGIQLLARLREAFRLPGLKLNKLIEKPTVAGHAESIEETRRSEIVLPDILVPLQPGGIRPPFFCMHPIGGDIGSLVDLSRYMAPDQPFYGIQAPGIGEVAKYGDYDSLEEMAAEYIAAIKFISPDGPYLLGGFSFGGLVAFEMSQQLTRQGHEVALLAMLDTPGPKTTEKLSQLDDATILFALARERARQRGTVLDISLDELRSLKTEDEQIMFVAEKLHDANLLPSGLEYGWIYSFIKGYRIRLNVALRYVPQIYAGRITMFLASERDDALEETYEDMELDMHNPTLGWDKWSSEPVEVVPVPGLHEMIVREPYVRTLAARMREAIDEAIMNMAHHADRIAVEPAGK